MLSKRMPRRNIVRERNERGFQLFLQNLKGVVSLCASDEVFWTEDLIEETTQRLQDSYTTLTLVESQVNDPLSGHVHRLKSNVQSLQRLLVSCDTSASSTESSVSFYPQPSPRMEGHGPGRPPLNITKEQIEYLRSIHFSWEKIAQLLHISVSTLQRRRRALGISGNFEQYSDISDDELDEIYKEITAVDTSVSSGGFLTPNIGRRRFIGALRSRGLRVQRWRVSNCLRRLDPVAGLLTGCDKKTEIMRYFRGRLCDKNGLLCDKLCKLCNFFLSYFDHILLGFRGRKPLWGCSKDKLNIKGQKLNIYG